MQHSSRGQESMVGGGSIKPRPLGVAEGWLLYQYYLLVQRDYAHGFVRSSATDRAAFSLFKPTLPGSDCRNVRYRLRSLFRT